MYSFSTCPDFRSSARWDNSAQSQQIAQRGVWGFSIYKESEEEETGSESGHGFPNSAPSDGKHAQRKDALLDFECLN